MTARTRPGIGAILLLILVALSTGAVPARADQLADKQAEAASIAAKLDDQAKTIVQLDKDRRRAQNQLDDANAAVARAQSDLAAAERRQDEARALLADQARLAYVSGGSVTFIGQMARATATDAGARRTYLGIATKEDRAAIDRLRATREDLQARSKALADAQKAAADRAHATDDQLAQFQQAVAAQKALLLKVNGDLAQLVAADQARRDAEAAQLAAARQTTVPTTAAPAKGAPATTAAPLTLVPTGPLTTSAPAPAGSNDSTFACIRQLESGNNYQSPGGGAYQFTDATWHSLGYSGTASDYPPAVQDEAARKLQARDGWSPWTTAALCGRV